MAGNQILEPDLKECEKGLQSSGKKHNLLPQGYECIKLVQNICADKECDTKINSLRYKIFC